MIGVYCRVSTEGQRDSYSIKQQRDDGINYAIKVDEEYEVYQDIWTGKELTRKGWESLKSDITSGKIDKVWIKIFDRLSRETRDALEIIDIMKANNVSLIVDGTYYDLHDYNVVMLLTIQFAVATNEGKRIVTRTIEGKKAEINAGKRRFCYVYGYDYEYGKDGRKKFYIVPEQAEVIRYIFNMAIKEKLPLSNIVKRLNSEGYKPLKVEYWEPSAVSRILQRIEYTGKTYNTSKEIIEHQFYDKIIDFNTWEKAQNIYESCITPNSRRGRNATHPATNILKCAKCGAGYYYHKGTRKKIKDGVIIKKEPKHQYAHKADNRYGRPKCNQSPKYISYENLNLLAYRLYYYAMTDPKNTESIMDKIDNKIKVQESQIEKDVERIEKRLKQIQKEVSNFNTAIAKGMNIESAIAEINKRQELLVKLNKTKQDQLQSLENSKQEYHVLLSEFSASKIQDYLKASNVIKRNMLQRILEYCRVDGTSVEAKLISGTIYHFNLDELKKETNSTSAKFENFKKLLAENDLSPEEKEEVHKKLLKYTKGEMKELFNLNKELLIRLYEQDKEQ